MSFKKSMSRRVVWTAFGAAAVSMLTANVYATEPTVEKVVRFTDLDLAKQRDAIDLYARLERAASVVCRAHDSREVARKSMKETCEQRALAAAVEDVNDARITALHSAGSRMRLAQRGASNEPRT
ncbi:MAG: UrcA family protein [Steroidobacter sp.]